nr:hypothetical protein [Spirochaetota bacterium]
RTFEKDAADRIVDPVREAVPRHPFGRGRNKYGEFSRRRFILFELHRIRARLDYAFTLPFGVEGTRHLLALTWKWDLPKYVFEYDPKKAAEMKRLHELEQQRLAEEEKKKTQTSVTNR